MQARKEKFFLFFSNGILAGNVHRLSTYRNTEITKKQVELNFNMSDGDYFFFFEVIFCLTKDLAKGFVI